MKKGDQSGQGFEEKTKIIHLQTLFEYVPICDKYKYLGPILTPKLTCGEQIFIKRKSGFHSSNYILFNAQLQQMLEEIYGKTMVKPLFNSALVLLKYEPLVFHKEKSWREFERHI